MNSREIKKIYALTVGYIFFPTIKEIIDDIGANFIFSINQPFPYVNEEDNDIISVLHAVISTFIEDCSMFISGKLNLTDYKTTITAYAEILSLETPQKNNLEKLFSYSPKEFYALYSQAYSEDSSFRKAINRMKSYPGSIGKMYASILTQTPDDFFVSGTDTFDLAEPAKEK